MRKLKKINGYLVVRFNDREKREYEGTGLGNFGVIDAELYTGILDVDRSVMEYDDIETLEIALEQARGLESELDVVEPEVQDAYITLEEAAAFEGIKYKTLAQRIARSPDQYDTKTQAREGGGKDQVLISVASLTAKARKAWRATQKVDGRDVIIHRLRALLLEGQEGQDQVGHAALEHEPVKKVGFGNSGSREDSSDERSESGNGNRQVIIQKLIMQADLKKIKDLQMLLSVLREIEDYSNGNGDADPEMIPSTV